MSGPLLLRELHYKKYVGVIFDPKLKKILRLILPHTLHCPKKSNRMTYSKLISMLYFFITQKYNQNTFSININKQFSIKYCVNIICKYKIIILI